MEESPPVPLTKKSGQRRNSYPKLRLKPLTLTLNRSCYSHKSYLNIQTPKQVTFTLSKVTDKLYLGSENDVRSLTDSEVNEKGINQVLSVQQHAVEDYECNPEILSLPVFQNSEFQLQLQKEKNLENDQNYKNDPNSKGGPKSQNIQNSHEQKPEPNSQKISETIEQIPEKTILKEKFKNIHFMHVKAADVTTTNLIDDFEKCIDFIDRNEGATIVHCQAGISRSATVCLAYLMKKRGYSLDEAFDYLKNCRGCIGPNFGFLGQLKIFEQRLKQGCR